MKKQWLLPMTLFVYSIGFVGAQSAQEVIDQSLKALGDKENYEQIHALHFTTTASQGPVSINTETKYDDEKGMFVQMDVMGRKTLIITNREQAWIKSDEDYEPKELESAEAIPALLEQFGKESILVISELLDMAATIDKVSLKKKQKKIDGKKCYVLEKLLPKDSMSVYNSQAPALMDRYYMHVKDYLLVRKEKEMYDAQNSSVITEVNTYADYRKVDHLLIPHKITTTIENVQEAAGYALVIKITAIRFNPEFAADVFTVEEGEYSEDF